LATIELANTKDNGHDNELDDLRVGKQLLMTMVHISRSLGAVGGPPGRLHIDFPVALSNAHQPLPPLYSLLRSLLSL